MYDSETNSRTMVTSQSPMVSSTTEDVQDHFQSLVTNEIQPPPSTPELDEPLFDCCAGGDIIPPPQISNDFDPYLNIPPPSDFDTFNRSYLGHWSGVENLFQLPIRPQQEHINWSTAPTPPPPVAFGINNDVVIEDAYEEESNVQNLASALDNIVLAQPNTNCEPKLGGLPYVDVDDYMLPDAPLNIRPWVQNDFPDGEHCYAMDNN